MIQFKRMAGPILAVLLSIIIIFMIFQSPWNFDVEPDKVATEDISHAMFEDWGFAVLLIGFLLFAAMIGGIYLAKEEPESFYKNVNKKREGGDDE